MVKNFTRNTSGWTCGCVVLILVLNAILGAWSINTILQFVSAKTIPFWGAATIGLFTGEFTIPIAVMLSILQYFGVL